MAKRGRRAKPHTAKFNGKTYEGLYKKPNSNIWRIVETGKQFRCDDEREAVIRFQHDLARAKGLEALVPIPALSREDIDDPDAEGAIAAVLLHELGEGEHRAKGDETLVLRIKRDDPLSIFRALPATALWSYVRDEIFRRRQYVAEMTGIEQIGYLFDIEKPKPSPTLDEVGKPYLTKANITPNWRQKSQSFWKEFCDSVKVGTLREITQESVTSYFDEIIERAAETSKKRFSATYVKHRFGQVKAILHFLQKRGQWTDDVARALNYCAVLCPPTSTTLDPHPISLAHFHAAFHAADAQMRAILLVAMNCCMYGQEVADLRWKDLHLDNRTLVMDRGKTVVARVSVLWRETIAALKAIPRTGEHVFITPARKGQHTSKTIGKIWRETIRPAATIPAEVMFRDIRDGAYTEAINGHGVKYEHARVLAGHRTGMSDHYVKRQPRMVEDACKAVYRAYMPIMPRQ